MKTNIELAREAGWQIALPSRYIKTFEAGFSQEQLDRFAALVESRYRERLLAGAGEPVAEFHADDDAGFVDLMPHTGRAMVEGDKLYLADQLAAERLRTEQAQAECERLREELAEADKMLNEQVAAHKAAVLAEREACAMVCEDFFTIEGIAQRCAGSIRSRSQS